MRLAPAWSIGIAVLWVQPPCCSDKQHLYCCPAVNTTYGACSSAVDCRLPVTITGGWDDTSITAPTCGHGGRVDGAQSVPEYVAQLSACVTTGRLTAGGSMHRRRPCNWSQWRSVAFKASMIVLNHAVVKPAPCCFSCTIEAMLPTGRFMPLMHTLICVYVASQGMCPDGTLPPRLCRWVIFPSLRGARQRDVAALGGWPDLQPRHQHRWFRLGRAHYRHRQQSGNHAQPR